MPDIFVATEKQTPEPATTLSEPLADK
ncbi:MAG: hypothetical protein ACD_50C00108G0002, partial [uncultured bacterium]